MKYIVVSKVKGKVKEIGYRSGTDFLSGLDLAVDVLIERAAEWVKPQKTLTREALIGYMTHHKIKI